ncbi:hypothetical protein IAD21_03656 [Abditibacteriota bacterium]|nr:hypothetical protein IAD21_03656 [Abditibacteriota bacterium]
MSPSRRLLLFFPLVVLTLFFAALGWRNWNLSMDDEEILAAVVADYRAPVQRPSDVINRVTSRASSPFADDELTIVSEGMKQGNLNSYAVAGKSPRFGLASRSAKSSDSPSDILRLWHRSMW